MVVDYLKKTVGRHNSYAYHFIFCEFLNLVNIIGQIFFMDRFFNHYFTNYGSEILSNLEKGERLDIMERVFPKVTKCTFHTYGFTGTLQNKDGKC